MRSESVSNWLTRLCYGGIAFIVMASVYDAWLVYAYREVIDEENKFCRWLISLEPTHVSIFMVAKLSGTAMVATSLVALLKYWSRVATPTIFALVAFQSGLMVYLHTYDSNRYRLLAEMRATEAMHANGELSADGRWIQNSTNSKYDRNDASNRVSNDRNRRQAESQRSVKRERSKSYHDRVVRARRSLVRFPGELAPENRPRKRPGRRMKAPKAT